MNTREELEQKRKERERRIKIWLVELISDLTQKSRIEVLISSDEPLDDALLRSLPILLAAVDRIHMPAKLRKVTLNEFAKILAESQHESKSVN